jgi:hypothetical protein
MSNQSLTIESVKKQFNDWRAQRGKMGSFPDDLWVNAVSLLDEYGATRVIRDLGITRKQLNDRVMRHSKIGDTTNTDFVELKITNNIQEQRVVEAKSVMHSTTSSVATNDSSSSIELKKPDGTTLTIHDLCRADVQTLVTTFMA